MTAGARVRKALASASLLGLLLISGLRALPETRVDREQGSLQFAHAIESSANTVAMPASSSVEARALDEMLRGARGQVQRWKRAPQLVVLGAVMEYRAGERAEYLATGETMTDAEMAQMVDDLTGALGVLTGNAFNRFSGVTFERPAAGDATRVTRADRIVVGRYQGVRRQLNTIGLGGRASRPDGTITAAAILLDADFDRTSRARRLLRMHELGHALGYNHVQSLTSIMNPRIGPEPTEFDLRAASIAFPK